MLTTQSDEDHAHAKEQVPELLRMLENEIEHDAIINDDFQMIDISYAHLFLRIHTFEKYYPTNLLDNKPKLKAWSQKLLSHPSVLSSIVENYENTVISNIIERNGVASKQISAAFSAVQ